MTLFTRGGKIIFTQRNVFRINLLSESCRDSSIIMKNAVTDSWVQSFNKSLNSLLNFLHGQFSHFPRRNHLHRMKWQQSHLKNLMELWAMRLETLSQTVQNEFLCFSVPSWKNTLLLTLFCCSVVWTAWRRLHKHKLKECISSFESKDHKQWVYWQWNILFLYVMQQTV